MDKPKKFLFICAQLIDEPILYENKTNTDIEKEIFQELAHIPYVAQIEKVIVLDGPSSIDEIGDFEPCFEHKPKEQLHK